MTEATNHLPDNPEGLCKGENLAKVLGDISSGLEDELLAEILGYFFTDEKGEKVALVDLFKKAVDESGIGERTDTYDIWDGRLCEPCIDHGGRIFVPKRIVISNHIPYDDADLDEFTVDFMKEQHEWEWMDHYDIQKEFDRYEFKEPMMTMEVIQYMWINPADLELIDWFTDEETAAFYSLRYEDCHECSTWSDG